MNDEPLHHPIESPSKRRFRSTIPVSAVTTLAAVLVATGSATAWWTWQTLSTRKAAVTLPKTETVVPSEHTATPGIDQAPGAVQSPTKADTTSTGSGIRAEMRSVSVYWVKDNGTHLEVVPSSISLEAHQTPEALLQQSFEHLLKGPENSSTDVASTIPAETRINSIEIRADGVHVDLNQAFTTGGGSTSMMGRLGQVVYTATTLDPEANVWISVEGTPLETLGGEGVMIAQPMTRQAFDRDFAL